MILCDYNLRPWAARHKQTDICPTETFTTLKSWCWKEEPILYFTQKCYTHWKPSLFLNKHTETYIRNIQIAKTQFQWVWCENLSDESLQQVIVKMKANILLFSSVIRRGWWNVRSAFLFFLSFFNAMSLWVQAILFITSNHRLLIGEE